MKIKKPQKKHNEATRYIKKWLTLLAVTLAVGGVFAFGLIVFLANAFGETKDTYNPIWMVYMIPLMFLIATPITIFIAKILYRHIDTLTDAMSEVANGNTDVYIPATGADAFASVYENFNKMAAEIAGIQQLRTGLVDSFSHELKTPISSINGFARLLLDKDISEEKRDKYLGIIIKESDRLASLAKNNLMLSKLDFQEIITDKKPYNLAKQLQQAAILLENEWAQKNINLSADLEDAEYVGNADLMESVWKNILSNAIKFTPRNGDINISLTQDIGFLTVAISDTGIGMSDEVQAQIFEKYYQAESSRTVEGHGLGLSIAKRIVKLCGGKITVLSKEGEGSTFTITLPK